MGAELNEQEVAPGTGAAPSGDTAAGAGTDQAASSAATAGTTGAPDIQAQIDAAVQEAIKQYEGEGGHLSRLKSKKDKEIAALRKQLQKQQKGKVEQAKALIESNPDQAAEILLGLAEEQDQQIAQGTAHQELVEWQHRILADLGADPEEDEEAAALAEEWAARLIEDPNLTWDFQHAAAQLQIGRERAASKEATKELKELKESLPETVNAAVTRALVAAGIVPEPSPEGGTPQREEDWRQKPASKLVKDGLAERKAHPIART
jgi:hypothetical protein